MARRWATLGELERLPRARVLEAIDLLDAYEEIEAENAPKPPRGRGNG